MNTDASSSTERLRTVVLLDPTADDGETALELLDASAGHVALVVLLHGRASNALHSYATSEGVSLATAGWTYLDQVAARIARPSRLIETVIATGPDPVFELSTMVSHGDVARVLLPSSLVSTDHATARQRREPPSPRRGRRPGGSRLLIQPAWGTTARVSDMVPACIGKSRGDHGRIPVSDRVGGADPNQGGQSD